MTYYQLNTYKHPPNTHFANVKYLYHKQTFKNWCSPVIKVKVIKVIKGFGGTGISDLRGDYAVIDAGLSDWIL